MALVENITTNNSVSEIISPTSASIRRCSDASTFDTHHSIVISLAGMPGQASDARATIIGTKYSPVSEILKKLFDQEKLSGRSEEFELAETILSENVVCKERRLAPDEFPVRIQLLWPHFSAPVAELYQKRFQFALRKRTVAPVGTNIVQSEFARPMDDLLRRLVERTEDREYPDLCNLPVLNEQALLSNLKQRFERGDIYTYVGSILISVNPFRFFPIYNPKYVEGYQGRQLAELPPHVFAIADAAYHTMLRDRKSQCVVISGESGSGKTECTNFILHHLSALSKRAFYSNGIEQSILGVGPVLEAFGNARTVHNDNSSRFGKFVQVKFKENGTVQGASVEKYLLEKSRIVSQAENERNYHVFYYLLAGAGCAVRQGWSTAELQSLCLSKSTDFNYLKQNKNTDDIEKLKEREDEFARLCFAMETVGFTQDMQKRIFVVLAAVLHLGNIEFKKKSEHGHQDESVNIKNMEQISIVSNLLKVTEQTLEDALTRRKALVRGDTVVMRYKMAEAIAARDVTAKCLYAALFDWIVLQINTNLLSKSKSTEHKVYSIGVLDIFGFEDFPLNSFEQFCINYANESLHYYFNQHIFKFEQEEYVREGIVWKNIEYIDNTACLELFSKKPTGLLLLLDEECSFPAFSNKSLLDKFNVQHQNNAYYEVPQPRQDAFIIVHYAGKVKYHIKDFREKNNDLMRHDIVTLLKNSNLAFIRELVGQDALAVLRWSLLRVFFRACFAFINAGKRHRRKQAENLNRYGGNPSSVQRRVLLLSDSSSDLLDDMEGPLSSTPKGSEVTGSLGTGVKVSRRRSCPSGSKSPNISVELSPQKTNQTHSHPEALAREKSFRKNRAIRPRMQQVKYMKEVMKVESSYRPVLGARTLKGKGKPLSNCAQFHCSLQKLMDSLNQSNPFFIRCIKSNADKAACTFDDDLVMRQLRYTGMLATVKIRQSGYNYRLLFQDFISMYHLLLPRGKQSTSADISQLLQKVDVHGTNYQIGQTKVFLREREKLLLDVYLHEALMSLICRIQQWFRAKLQRKAFKRKVEAVMLLQSWVRGMQARKRLKALRSQRTTACVTIQKLLRGHIERKRYRNLLSERSSTGSVADSSDLLPSSPQFAQSVTLVSNCDSTPSNKKTETSSTVFMIEKPNEPLLDASIMIKVKLGENMDVKENKKQVSILDVRLEPVGEVRVEQPEVKSSAEVNRVERLDDVKQDTSVDKIRLDADKKLNISVDGSDQSVDSTSRPSPGRTESPVGSDKKRKKNKKEETASPTVLRPDRKSVSETTLHNAILRTGVTSVFPVIDLEAEPVSRARSRRSEILQIELSLPDVADGGGVSKVGHADLDTNSKIGQGDLNIGTKVDHVGSEVSHVDLVSGDKVGQADPDKESSSDSGRVFKDSEGRISAGSLNTISDKLSVRTTVESSSAYGSVQFDPTDVESISSHPLSKSSSEESVISGSWKVQQGRRRLPRKDIGAPIARMESFNECSIDEEDEYQPEVHRIVLDVSEPRRGSDSLVQSQTNLDDSQVTQSSIRSPFLNVKKNAKKLKNIINNNNASSPSGSEVIQAKGPPVSQKPKRNSLKKKYSSSGSQQSLAFSHEQLLQQSQATETSHALLKDQVNKTKGKSQGSKFSSDEQLDENKGQLGVTLNEQSTSNWNLANISAWQYPQTKVVENVNELKQLEIFISIKLESLSSVGGRKDTSFDVVFKESLANFRTNLLTLISTASTQENAVEYKYCDFMHNFEKVLEARARQCSEEFAMTIGINSFRVFMDEFSKKKENRELPELKTKKKAGSVKNKKKRDNVYEYLGHKFVEVKFNIRTYCEQCNSSLWGLERGQVCKVCKLTVHKTCLPKVTGACNATSTGPQIPPIVEKLMSTIEMTGMYTVGIYRKPGAMAKVKELNKIISKDAGKANLSEYNIHVLTSALKAFFRSMPEPLMTFQRFDEFLRVSEIEDEIEQMKCLYATIDKLPKPNYDLLERLVFHLAKIAAEESSNKMSAEALATIFAPCILAKQNALCNQESLVNVTKQSKCVKLLIENQMRKIERSLAEIKDIDTRTGEANERLTALRKSRRGPKKDQLTLACVDVEEGGADDSLPRTPDDERAEMNQLTQQILSYGDVRDELTNGMPSLDFRISVCDDDELSVDDVDSTEELDSDETTDRTLSYNKSSHSLHYQSPDAKNVLYWRAMLKGPDLYSDA